MRFEEKINPKPLPFGSRIEGSEVTRREYSKIRDIPSPEVFLPDNDLKVSLIGVRTVPEKRGKAMQFLRHRLHGQRVYLKYGDRKYDYDVAYSAICIEEQDLSQLRLIR